MPTATTAQTRIGSARSWALATALVVSGLTGFAQTMPVTATPALVENLHGFALYGWVTAAFAFAQMITLPVFGKASDSYGRRPLLLLSLAIFTVGSILAAVAPSMPWLIAAQVVAGLGGGGMFSLAVATIADAFAPRERARWLGIASTTWGLASIAGPAVGGVITDQIGWRYVFLVLAPLAAFASALAAVSLPRVEVRQRARLDLGGAAVLAAAILAFMLAFTWGGSRFAWRSWQEAAALGSAGCLGGLFAAVERRSAEPLVDLRLFRSRLFTLTLLTSFALVGAWAPVLTFTPLLLQGVARHSASGAGVAIVPMTVAFAVGAAATGELLTSTGRSKLLSLVGAGLVTAALAIFATLSANPRPASVDAAMVAAGLGVGMLTPIVTVGAQSAFSQAVVGTATAARSLFAQAGWVIVVPIATTVMVGTFRSRIEAGLPAAAKTLVARGELDPQRLLTEQSQERLGRRFAALPNAADVQHRFVRTLHDALMSGITDAYAIGLGLSCAVFVLVLVLPRLELDAK